jgi:hypothetical protein
LRRSPGLSRLGRRLEQLVDGVLAGLEDRDLDDAAVP